MASTPRWAHPLLAGLRPPRQGAVLAGIDRRRADRFLRYGREGRVDLLVEWSSLAGQQVNSEALWQCVLDIGWNLLKKSGTEQDVREFAKIFEARTYAEFLKKRPAFIDKTDTIETTLLMPSVTVRTSGRLTAEYLWCGMVVANGPARVNKLAFNSIVIATGDVSLGMPSSLVVIADGNIDAGLVHSNCVLVARGKVTGGLYNDPTISGYERAVGRSPTLKREVEQYDLLYRPGEPPRRIYLPGPPANDEPAPAVVKKAVPAAPPPPRDDGIQFFELAGVGLGLELAGGLVAVATL